MDFLSQRGFLDPGQVFALDVFLEFNAAKLEFGQLSGVDASRDFFQPCQGSRAEAATASEQGERQVFRAAHADGDRLDDAVLLDGIDEFFHRPVVLTATIAFVDGGDGDDPDFNTCVEELVLDDFDDLFRGHFIMSFSRASFCS